MPRKKQPIAIDLFSGVGGMSLGFRWAGFNVVASVERDPIHVETYRKNFSGSKVVNADVKTVSAESLLDETGLKPGMIDVVFGGPPCQGFSLIGKRDAEDPRNELLFEFARLVLELQPKYFVMENVAGLMSGVAADYVTLFQEKVAKEYCVVRPIRILNARDFGVPQDRKRVFVLGYRRGLSAPSYPSAKSKAPTVWDAIGDLPTAEAFDVLLESDIFEGELQEPVSDYARRLRNDKPLNGKKKPVVALSGLQATAHTAAVTERFRATQPGETETVSRFKRLEKTGCAPTLRAGTGPELGSFMAARPIHPEYPRCITTREAARLHSFPDWFDFHETKWHGFKQIGNSVPPLLAFSVARNIASILINEKDIAAF